MATVVLVVSFSPLRPSQPSRLCLQNHFVAGGVDNHISELDLPPGVLGLVLIADMVFVQQSAGLDIQIFGERICRHAHIGSIGKFGRRTCPFALIGLNERRYSFKHSVGWLLVQLIFRFFQLPDLRFWVFL